MLEDKPGSEQVAKPFEHTFTELCQKRAEATYKASQLWHGAHKPEDEAIRQSARDLHDQLSDSLVEAILSTPSSERWSLLSRANLIIKNNSLYVSDQKPNIDIFFMQILLRALEITEQKNPAD